MAVTKSLGKRFYRDITNHCRWLMANMLALVVVDNLRVSGLDSEAVKELERIVEETTEDNIRLRTHPSTHRAQGCPWHMVCQWWWLPRPNRIIGGWVDGTTVHEYTSTVHVCKSCVTSSLFSVRWASLTTWLGLLTNYPTSPLIIINSNHLNTSHQSSPW